MVFCHSNGKLTVTFPIVKQNTLQRMNKEGKKERGREEERKQRWKDRRMDERKRRQTERETDRQAGRPRLTTEGMISL